jgi:hypothetical protein
MAAYWAQAPSLLDELFNGLLWTSKSASTTEEGIIRVNYYVRRRTDGRTALAARRARQASCERADRPTALLQTFRKLSVRSKLFGATSVPAS